MARPVIRMVTGVPGVGKSAYLTRMICSELLTTSLKFVTNLPLKREAIADWCLEQKKGLDRDEILDRIVLVSKETTDKWIKGEEEFWESLEKAGVDLGNTHLVIDEVHYVYPSGKSSIKPRLERLEVFLSTMRHEGCSIDFCTQNPTMVAPIVGKLAGRRVNLASWREESGFAGIKNDDFMQVRAAFNGGKIPLIIIVQEWVKDSKGRDKLDRSEDIALGWPWFDFYDSYNAVREGSKGQRQREPWEDHPRFAILRWFVARNFKRLLWNKVTRIVLLLVVLVILTSKLPKVLRAAGKRASGTAQAKMESVKKKESVDNEDTGEGNEVVEKDEDKEDAFKELERRVEGMQIELDKAKKQIERLGKVRALGRSWAYIGDQYVRLGEKVDKGPMAGLVLVRVDTTKRTILCSDGVWYGM